MQMFRKEYGLYQWNMQRYKVKDRYEITELLTEFGFNHESAKIMANNVLEEMEDVR